MLEHLRKELAEILRLDADAFSKREMRRHKAVEIAVGSVHQLLSEVQDDEVEGEYLLTEVVAKLLHSLQCRNHGRLLHKDLLGEVNAR